MRVTHSTSLIGMPVKRDDFVLITITNDVAVANGNHLESPLLACCLGDDSVMMVNQKLDGL